MNTFLFSGVAAVGLMVTGAPADASSAVSAIGSAPTPSALVMVANGRKAGSSVATPGRYNVSFRPRPGFNGIPRTDVYRRPYRGFILPSYWVQPTFYVSNFNRYGLSTPMRGYNWTRYYDDAVLTDSRGYVQDYRSGINWNDQNDRTSDYQEAEYGPAILPDGNAYNWNDDSNVAYAAPDGSSYSYDGNWQGNYVDPQGRVFEGEWEGRVTRQDGVAGPGYPAPRQPAPAPAPRRPTADAPYDETYNDVTYGYNAVDREDYYTVPRGYENYERCLKSNGLKGAAIGALLGGLAGNRIAGRGNRTGGSLLGAGIGGLLGVAAEKANNKCRQHHPSAYRSPAYSYAQPQQPYYYYAQPQQVYYYAPQPQQYSAAPMQGGYYYYPQAMPATTVVTGAPYTTTTTTVTEEIYYQNLPSAPRKKAVRKWKPKPRCSCR